MSAENRFQEIPPDGELPGGEVLDIELMRQIVSGPDVAREAANLKGAIRDRNKAMGRLMDWAETTRDSGGKEATFTITAGPFRSSINRAVVFKQMVPWEDSSHLTLVLTKEGWHALIVNEYYSRSRDCITPEEIAMEYMQSGSWRARHPQILRKGVKDTELLLEANDAVGKAHTIDEDDRERGIKHDPDRWTMVCFYRKGREYSFFNCKLILMRGEDERLIREYFGRVEQLNEERAGEIRGETCLVGDVIDLAVSTQEYLPDKGKKKKRGRK